MVCEVHNERRTSTAGNRGGPPCSWDRCAHLRGESALVLLHARMAKKTLEFSFLQLRLTGRAIRAIVVTMKGRPVVHGERKGKKSTPEYQAWAQMKQRCLNPKHPAYPRYGGRGIKIDSRWEASFQDFLADVGRKPSPKHSLDRINNEGGYFANNVRWATHRQQQQNTSSVKLLEFEGEILCKAALARRFGISRSLLGKRLTAEWPLGKALKTSSRKRKR